MFIDNARWDGVPFLLKAGKALASRAAEIRVQFRHVPGNLFRGRAGADLDRATNELVGRAPSPALPRLPGALLRRGSAHLGEPFAEHWALASACHAPPCTRTGHRGSPAARTPCAVRRHHARR